jgi:hypothetical protein
MTVRSYDHDRQATPYGLFQQPDPGVHDERRSGDEQRVGRPDEGRRRGELGRRNELPEEDHVGLQHPLAHRAGRDDHLADGVDVDIAVGVELHVLGFGEPRVLARHPYRDVFARELLPAGHAEDPIHRTVHVDHVARPGAEVEAVDVLGDDTVHDSGEFQIGDRLMPGVGTGGGEVAPPQVAARPVALPSPCVPQEGLERHRIAHRRALTAIVRNPRVGAHAGSRQHGDPAPGEQALRLIDQRMQHRVEGRQGRDRHGASFDSGVFEG